MSLLEPDFFADSTPDGPYGPGLSALDIELARWARRQVPDAPQSLLWAVALVSRAHGCGHTALDLSLPLDELLSLLAPGQPEDGPALASLLTSWLPLARHALGMAPESSERPGPLWQDWPALLSADAPHHPTPLARAPVGLLVWSSPRLYLNRCWRSESEVARGLSLRAGAAETIVANEALVDRLLSSWFQSAESVPTVAGQGGGKDTRTAINADIDSDQQQACRAALHQRLTVITGGPGTGKTHTAARLLALVQACRRPGTPALRVALAAPTGKAAARLRESLESAWATLDRAGLSEDFWSEARAAIEPATTVHALLGSALKAADPEHTGRLAPPLALDLLLVDEASMLDLSLAEALLRALPPSARLVLLGDRQQLASVEAGSVLADMVDGLGAGARASSVVRLSGSRRFSGPIAAWAQAVLQGRSEAIEPLLNEAARRSEVSYPVRLVPPSAEILAELAVGPEGHQALWTQIQALRVQPWTEAAVLQALQTLDEFRVLCAVRQGPWGVERCNLALERAFAQRGWMPLQEEWYHGRAVMITRNSPALGLSNGDVGLVLREGGTGRPRFYWLQGTDVRQVACSRLAHAETAWAMTIHKSQGSEFERVAVLLPPGRSGAVSRELIYTGLTRARRRLWWAADPASIRAGAQRVTRRMGGLADRLVQAIGP